VGGEGVSVMTRVPRFLSAVQRRRRAAAMAAVVLVLMALTGGLAVTWAAATAYEMANAPLAHVDRNGLRLTMRVGPGPYFLRELLPVSLSLTNLSGTMMSVLGPVKGNMGINEGCGSIFSVTETGGHAPTYEAPSTGGMTCPGPLPEDLAPGQTVSASDFLPITASGRLTVTAGVSPVSIVIESSNGQTHRLGTGADPFEGHGPSVQLTVNSGVPLQRMVWVSRVGTHVFVIAPPAVWSHLVYLYNAGADGCSTGSYAWISLNTLVIDMHPCAGRYGTWQYAVSAPGYAIAEGTAASP
jgi:hypothetical protein